MIKTIFAFVVALTLAFVQPTMAKSSEVETSYFMADFHCQSCVERVMNRLPFQKGVKDVKPDLAMKTLSVSFDPTKTNDEQILATLKKVNVKATKLNEEQPKTDGATSATKQHED